MPIRGHLVESYFERLAELNAPAHFHILHGTSDWNTPVDGIRELERWASTQPLNITFTYFDGGHNDAPEAARTQVTELVWRVTATPARASTGN